MRARRTATRSFAVATALFAVVLMAGVASADSGTLTANLSGGNEVPPNDSGATGTAEFTLDSDSGEVCWELTADGINDETGPVVAAHIHRGEAGVNGDIVIPLTVDAEGNGSGCDSKVDAMLIREILDDPDGFYANTHSEEFPGGVIRGQLAGLPDSSTIPAAPAPTTLPALLLLAVAAFMGLRLGTVALRANR
ncbi:MAG: CHRD domain-containing protein [Chloroflexi bacterium]|nr:CHRD domain-containing protein [Chloroflexota bacterium]